MALRSRNARRLLLLLLCLALSPPASYRLWGQGFQLGNIVGQVRVARGGAPPERVMVTLESRAITFGTVYTDEEGRFAFYALPSNLYHVIVKDPKYRPVQVDIPFNPAITPSTMVQITLEAVETKDPDAGTVREPPASGGNPNLVDVSDYTKDFPKKAVEMFKKALRSEQQGKADEAVRGYRSAIQVAPNFYPAHNQLGVMLLARRDFSAAQLEFEEVIRLNQADANAYFNLGNVFLLTDRLDDAVRVLEEGLRKQPNSGLGKFLMGSAYRRSGKFAEAERALHDAISFDATLGNAHLELVNLYLRENRTPEAISELKAFLKAFPSDAKAPQAREMLTRLEAAPLQPAKATQ